MREMRRGPDAPRWRQEFSINLRACALCLLYPWMPQKTYRQGKRPLKHGQANRKNPRRTPWSISPAKKTRTIPELVFCEGGGHDAALGAHDVLHRVRVGRLLGWHWTGHRAVPCQQRNGGFGVQSDDVWVWPGTYDLGAVE